MSRLRKKPRDSRHLAIPIFAVALLTACARVRFVSEYDAVIDQRTTDLAATFLTFEARMERLAGSPAGTYAENADFYDDTRGAIEALKMRAGQHEKNEETIKMFGQLEENLEKLRTLHEREGDKGLRKVLVEPAIATIEAQCSAITKLELEKKKSDAIVEANE